MNFSFLVVSTVQKAFDALCHSTHLYGRRLVLEWAAVDEDSYNSADDNDASKIGRKTAQKFYEGTSVKRAEKVLMACSYEL